jgi:hypothetical protein
MRRTLDKELTHVVFRVAERVESQAPGRTRSAIAAMLDLERKAVGRALAWINHKGIKRLERNLRR